MVFRWDEAAGQRRLIQGRRRVRSRFRWVILCEKIRGLMFGAAEISEPHPRFEKSEMAHGSEADLLPGVEENLGVRPSVKAET